MALLGFLATSPAPASAEAPSAVRVTGVGSTMFEAKQDAIRQAVQLSLTQLIVVDRQISDDTVIRDQVLSTMNGYVQTFDVVEVARDQQQVSITADIVVSSSTILNYVGSPAQTGAAVSGEAAFAEAQRAIGQRTARGEMLDRFFRGFPADHYQVKLLGLNVSEMNPESLQLRFEISIDPLFVKALRSYLEQVSVSSRSSFRVGDIPSLLYDRSSPGSTPICLLTNPVDERLSGQWLVKGDCYYLPPGNYFTSMKRYFSARGLQDPAGLFVVSFQDGAGKAITASTSMLDPASGHEVDVGSCILFDRGASGREKGSGGSPFQFYRVDPGFGDEAVVAKGTWELDIFLAPQTVEVNMPLDGIDLSSVRRSIGRVAVAVDQYSDGQIHAGSHANDRLMLITDLQKPPQTRRAACDELQAAERKTTKQP